MKLTNSLAMAAVTTFLVITVFQSVSGQETCDGIGNVLGKFEVRDRSNFYINVAAPANCSGYINSFSFCYYRPPALSNIQYVFTFALYKESSGTYNNVSRTFIVKKTLSDIQSELGNNDFVCANLPVSEPVPVEAGDVLGACVYNPDGDGIDKLDIVSRVVSGVGNLLRAGATVCGPNTLPSTITPSDTSMSRFLYLQAEIVPPTEPPPTMETTAIIETTPPITDATVNVPSTVTMSTLVTIVPATGTIAETESTPLQSETTPLDNKTTMNELSTTVSMETGSSSNTTGIPTGGGDGGAVLAVVVVLLIVLVMSAVIVVVVVLLVMKRKSTKRDYSPTTTDSVRDGIDNMLYATTDQVTGNGEPSEYAEIGFSQPLYELPNTSCNGNGTHFSDLYAKEGPYEEVHQGNLSASAYEIPSTNIYESPLDELAISYSKLLEKNKEEDIYGSVDPFTEPASQDDDVYAQLKKWSSPIIPPTNIKVEGHLGSGQFGSVEKGQWKRPGTKPVDVALKTLNKTGSEDRLKFLQEAATMAQFKHPNVILLHGVVSRGDPMMLVVELASKGDLRELLLSMRPDPGELVTSSTPNLFLRFSQQVALGMQYLSAKGFVHRDLAARNVLVSTSEVCKISDFGMSRDLADETYYVSHGGMIPVKWTAPEAIHYKKYSTGSDVWAYGCLLYEIWSVGHKPFEGVSNVNTIRLIDSGERLSPPPGCPKMIYELMTLCWHQQTYPRPSFHDIVLTLVGNEKVVLEIPTKDSSTDPLAGVLGALLEAGENMYTELQKRYLSDEVAI